MSDLRPWYAVATPHEDIQGRLAETVFAANLWAVVQNTAARQSGNHEVREG